MDNSARFRAAAVAGICAALFAGMSASAAGAEQDDTTEALTEFGDVMQFALPLAALGATFAANDPDGRAQFFKSYLTAWGTTTTLKGVYGKLRPESKSRTSYPSGHTTSAFAGAAFIDQRYGHLWGGISYAAAVLTGYSRVRSENHFGDDVLAGASIGIMSNWFWTTPHKTDVALVPMEIQGAPGLGIVVLDPSIKRKKEIDLDQRPPKYHYELSFGGAYLQTNEVTSPSDTGTTFDLADFRLEDDPTTTAMAIWQWYMAPRHRLTVSLAPFESRDTGQFSSPVSFAGATIPANTDVRSSWVMYDLRTTYGFDLTPASRWDVRVGGALSFQYTDLSLETPDGTLYGEVEDRVVLPLLHAYAGYDIGRRWHVGAELSGISLSSDRHLDGYVRGKFQIDKHWDTTFGVGVWSRDIDVDEFRNKIRYDIAFIGVGYTFY